MPKVRPWFRVYSEIKSDPKLRRCTPGERWLWVVLLCIAWESPLRGHLLISKGIPYETRDIAKEADLDPEVVEKALSKFEAMHMLHREEGVWVVTNFNKRQYDKKSDMPEYTRARKRAQREREKQVSAAAESSTPAAAAVEAGLTEKVMAAGSCITVTSENTGSPAESYPTVTPVSRQCHATSACTTENHKTHDYRYGRTGVKPLPSSEFAVYTYPAKSQSHVGITLRSRQSHTPYKEIDLTGIQITDTDITEINNLNNLVVSNLVVDSSNNTRAQKIQKALQSAGILTPSPLEIEKLDEWISRGMEMDTVKLAIEKAALAGKRRVDYIVGTLRNWFNAGLFTKQQVLDRQSRFKGQKRKGGLACGRSAPPSGDDLNEFILT